MSQVSGWPGTSVGGGSNRIKYLRHFPSHSVRSTRRNADTQVPPRGVLDPRGVPPAPMALLGRGPAAPRPPGASAPLPPLNAAAGTPAPVLQRAGSGSRIRGKLKNLVAEARRGGQGPDRRSRPSTRQCGRGSCPPTTRRASAVWATRSVVHASASVLAVVKARTGVAGRPHVSVGGGLVHGPSGGRVGDPRLRGRPGAAPPGRHFRRSRRTTLRSKV